MVEFIESIGEMLQNAREYAETIRYKQLPTKEEYENSILQNEYSEPIYLCPECKKGGMCRNLKIISTSYPPKHKYKCNKCGHIDYQYM